MQDLLKTLYRIFYETRGMHDLPPDAEAAYRSLMDKLTKEDSRLLLKVTDARTMVAEQAAENSFICGFRLATMLAAELITDTRE